MQIRRSIHIALVFLLGVVIGAVLFRPASVHAGGHLVYLDHVKIGLDGSGSALIMGGSVVGVSCTRDEDGQPTCFVASQ